MLYNFQLSGFELKIAKPKSSVIVTYSIFCRFVGFATYSLVLKVENTEAL